MPVKPFLSKKTLTALLVCGWLAATSWGMWRLAGYSFAPGAQGAAPESWPAGSTLARDSARPTVVIAVHPECPCSEATMEELDSIAAQSAGRLRMQVLFVALPGLPPVEDSDLWSRASRIAGVEVIKDPDGIEAGRFGTLTSGETRLYGTDGRLLFRGGITSARGHVGDNPGQAAVIALLAPGDHLQPPVTTPVFGCALGNARPAKTP